MVWMVWLPSVGVSQVHALARLAIANLTWHMATPYLLPIPRTMGLTQYHMICIRTIYHYMSDSSPTFNGYLYAFMGLSGVHLQSLQQTSL